MRGINPCPYCQGEVEVIKLNKKKPNEKALYRIECLHCRRLVARGTGFEIETSIKAMERIEQYENVMKKLYGPRQPRKIEQSADAKRRDRLSGKPRYDQE